MWQPRRHADVRLHQVHHRQPHFRSPALEHVHVHEVADADAELVGERRAEHQSVAAAASPRCCGAVVVDRLQTGLRRQHRSRCRGGAPCPRRSRRRRCASARPRALPACGRSRASRSWTAPRPGPPSRAASGPGRSRCRPGSRSSRSTAAPSPADPTDAAMPRTVERRAMGPAHDVAQDDARGLVEPRRRPGAARDGDGGTAAAPAACIAWAGGSRDGADHRRCRRRRTRPRGSAAAPIANALALGRYSSSGKRKTSAYCSVFTRPSQLPSSHADHDADARRCRARASRSERRPGRRV